MNTESILPPVHTGLIGSRSFQNYAFKGWFSIYTMNRNEKSESVYVWGEILLRNMVFAHH